MFNRFLILFFILLGFNLAVCNGQKVGVVLSGGGASAMAHIGVLKALEEQNIPIDYITGTSMGAVIGGLYASGYSPKEIETLVLSTNFLLSAEGELRSEDIYSFNIPAQTPNYFEIKINPKKPLSNSIPTSLVSPYILDYTSIALFAPAGIAAKNNFDSLLIPFRCVATNVTAERTEVFKSGALKDAIRASSTYPFYYNPIEIDGHVMMDGGLYNNFPVDVMINEFNPDVIIGVNVSNNFENPDKNDILSQVKKLLVKNTDYSLKEKKGIILKPINTVATFGFEDAEKAIQSGYDVTIDSTNSLKKLIVRESLNTDQKRFAFNSKKENLETVQVKISGNLNDNQKEYITKSLLNNKKYSSINSVSLDHNYRKLFTDPFLSYVYPNVTFDSLSNGQVFTLQADRKEDIILSIGGNLSSKPITTAYAGITLNLLDKYGYQFHANTFFGKYYSSVAVRASLFKPGVKTNFSISPYYIRNQWDYFRSFTTFFQEKKPSFIVNNEEFFGIELNWPIGYWGKLNVDVNHFSNLADYYQTEEFTATDTTDQTLFWGNAVNLSLEGNTVLNKQFNTAGRTFTFKASYIKGKEDYQSGSTSPVDSSGVHNIDWIEAHLNINQYFPVSKKVFVGFHGDAVFSSSYSFSNFKANSIFAPAFQPTTESKTLFLKNFRSNKYLAFGVTTGYLFTKMIHWRISGYMYQPIVEVQTELSNTFVGGNVFPKWNAIVSSTVVLDTPVGQLSAQVNYYDEEETKLTFLLNFGYILFNRSPR